MEKEHIEKVNKLFYQVTENLYLEEIDKLVEKLNTYLHIQNNNYEDI